MQIAILKYQDYHSIKVNSLEIPRISWSHKINCWRYRLKLERSHEYGKRPIDNIDAGYLLAWQNPIQLGIDLLNPGGEVFIPAGTYVQMDTTINGVDSLKLTGSGYASMVKMAKTVGTIQDLFRFENVDYVDISHLRLWGNSLTIYGAGYASEHDHAFAFMNVSNVKLSKCWIEDMCGDGIYIEHNSADGQIIITDNHISIPNREKTASIGRNCIAIVQGKHVIIKNNILKYGYPAVIDLETNPDGDYVVSDIIIKGNDITGGEGYGINIQATQETAGKISTVEDILIANNIIKESDCSGIQVWRTKTAGEAYVQRIKIADNEVINCNDGMDSNRNGAIEINSATDVELKNNTIIGSQKHGLISLGCSRIDLSGNTFETNQWSGVFFSGTIGTEQKYIKIHNNICRNNGQAGPGHVGIECQYVDYLDINNNFCNDDQDVPTQKYGIELLNCDFLTFGRVIGFGNTVQPWRIAGCANVRMNCDVKMVTFWYDNLAANQANTLMKIGSDEPNASIIEMPFDGQIVAISITANADVTAGTVTLIPVIEDVAQNGHTITLTTSTPARNQRILGDLSAIFNAGDYIGLLISSDADLLPVGSLDIRGTLFII